MINLNVLLAKATRVFDVRVVLSTVETESFSGNMWPQIKAVFQDRAPIERTSLNSWDDAAFVTAVERVVPARNPCARNDLGLGLWSARDIAAASRAGKPAVWLVLQGKEKAGLHVNQQSSSRRVSN